MLYFKYNMLATGSQFILRWSSVVRLAVHHQYTPLQTGRDKHLVVPACKTKKIKNPVFYSRYDAFHAMIDTNVTFPRSYHPFEKSGNNPHAIFSTCLARKLLIHIEPSPLRCRRTATTQCSLNYQRKPPGCRLFASSLVKQEDEPRSERVSRAQPQPPGTPHSGAGAAEPSRAEQPPPRRAGPGAASRCRSPPLRCCCCCCPAPPPPAAAAAAAAAGPAAGGAPPARPPREGSLAAAGRGGGGPTTGARSGGGGGRGAGPECE